MRLEYQILLAVLLDLMVGDPRWLPHPVKLIGRLAISLEHPLRRSFRAPRIAGTVACVTVVCATIVVTWSLVRAANYVHPLVGATVGVIIMYTGIAARDLARHSSAVWRALARGDIEGARIRVGMICGRDADRLDEAAAVRATVESVAENVVDGVTAPLFFAALAGPAGIMAYKAVSTLDSTFGYKSEEYREFGWASARLDDVAAFVPSRLTALLVPVAASILSLRARDSWRIFLRDRTRHPSPNAGHCESAFAGALGVQLGGLSYYRGEPSHKPTLGDPRTEPEPKHIRRANALMLVTSVLFLAGLLSVRLLTLAILSKFM
jgi:adenosylcobinamide-phosphate synthase